MFGSGFFGSNKTDDDQDFKGSDYVIVTVVLWNFLCFNWTHKTIKAFRKSKEGETLYISSL